MRLLILSCLFVTNTLGTPLSPDILKIYHDITSGRGLYSEFDKIYPLNANNFKQEVFNSSTPKSWIVEFYNSWCGHCHRFAPVWKMLAVDIYEWKDIVSIGAVDCSNPENTVLCREYEVMYYPMVKYFPKSSQENFLGVIIKSRTVENLRHDIINLLKDRPDLPQISTFEGRLEDIWRTGDIEKALIVVEDNSSFIGSELALDLLPNEALKVLLVPSGSDIIENFSVSSLPALYLIDKSDTKESIPLSSLERNDILKTVGAFLKPKGYFVPTPLVIGHGEDQELNVSQAMELKQIEAQIKKKLNANELSDVVFQVDIEGALKHSLLVEISSHKTITDGKLQALNHYLKVLMDYFPFGKSGKTFLTCLKDGVGTLKHIQGDGFHALAEDCGINHRSVFLPTEGGWLGCRGSLPKYRGYPCGLWTMFHTLTVQADLKGAKDSKEVLNSMTGYIKHFFGCTECSKHFQQMAVTMAGNVSSTEESVLWLWKAHNTVNKRLKGDASEDPKHVKIQFPSHKICQNCTQDGEWNEAVVLEFLRKMYTNISFLVIEDIQQSNITHSSGGPAPAASNSLRAEVVHNENTAIYNNSSNSKILWDLNLFDVSLCVVLYGFSMAIIVLVCIKFYKKTYRKKTYLLDIFQKV